MLTILVVDDDPDQRAALADALGHRHRVTGVADVDAALAESPARFDLVITDLRMPGRSGLELKRALGDAGVQVPVVLMSSDVHARELAMTGGFFDALAKPVSLDLLEAIIARVAAEKEPIISADNLMAASETPPTELVAGAPSSGDDHDS